MPDGSGMIIAVGLLLLALAAPLYRQLERNFLYLVLPLNVLADALIIFAGEGAFHSGLLRGLLLLAFIAISFRHLRADRLTVSLYAFLGYLALLAMLSSDPGRSFSAVLKLFISMSFIPMVYYLVRDREDLRRLHIGTLAALAVAIANFGLTQVYQTGIVVYSEDAALLGGGGVYITYVIAYALIVSPLTLSLLRSRSGHLLAIGLYIVGAIVMLLVFRRAAIVAALVGFAVLLWCARGGARQRLVSLGAGVLLVLALSFPLWGSSVVQLYDQRVRSGVAMELAAERGRLGETGVVFEELSSRGLRHFLIGTDLFNSSAHFVRTRGWDRNLHVDYNALLHGAGVVGLGWFLLIYWRIIQRFRRGLRWMHGVLDDHQIRGVCWALLVASLLLSASSQLYVVTAYTMFCAHVGAMLRLCSDGEDQVRQQLAQRRVAAA